MRYLSRSFKPRRFPPAPVQIGDALGPLREKIAARWLRQMVGPDDALAGTSPRVRAAALTSTSNDVARLTAAGGSNL
jgi:hypothetical protein